MIKKTISLLLIFAMILTIAMPVNVFAATKDYAGHWAEETIQTWLDNGYVTGYPDGSFKPEGLVTRAEFVTMVNKLFNYSETADISFTDVSASDWYYKEVQKSVKAGYIAGLSETKFAPNENLTREQAAVIVSKIMKLQGDSTGANIFTDKTKVSEWALEYVGSAAKAQIIKGYDSDSTFRPHNPIKRAEAVSMLDRIIVSTEAADLTIDKAGTVVENKTYKNIHITEKVGNGEVTLKNVKVTGELLVEGGGENSIIIEDSTINQLTANKKDGKVRILVTGDTAVYDTAVLSGVTLEQDGLTGTGFEQVIIDEDANESQTITLKANLGELAINAKVKINIKSGEIEEIVIDKEAEGASINLAKDAKALLVTVNAKVSFTGTGTIINAEINVSEVTFEKKPEDTIVAPGVKDPEIKTPSTGGGGGSGVPDSVAVTGVALNKSSIVLVIGDTETLHYTISPSNATNRNVTWKSSDVNIATVENGIVTAKSTGSAIVTVITEDNNKETSCEVTVTEDPAEAELARAIEAAEAAMSSYLLAGGKKTDAVYASVAQAIESDDIDVIISATAELNEATEVLEAGNAGQLAEAKEALESAMSAYLAAGGSSNAAVYKNAEAALNSEILAVIISVTAELSEATEALEAGNAGQLAEAKEALEAAMSAYLAAGGSYDAVVYKNAEAALNSETLAVIISVTAELNEATEALEAGNAGELAEAKEALESAMSAYLAAGGSSDSAVYENAEAALNSETLAVIISVTAELNEAKEALESGNAGQLAEAKETLESAMSAYLAVGGSSDSAVYENAEAALNSETLEVITSATAELNAATEALEAAQGADLSQAKEAAEAAMNAYLLAGGLENDPVYVALIEALESNNVINIVLATVELNAATEDLEALPGLISEAREALESAMSAYLAAGGSNVSDVYKNAENAYNAEKLEVIVSATDDLNDAAAAIIEEAARQMAEALEAAHIAIDAYLAAHGSKDADVYKSLEEAINADEKVLETIISATNALKAATEALDIIPPIITLNGESSVKVANGAAYTDAGVTITDNKDTNLTATVTYTKDDLPVTGIDTKIAGTYIIHYNVSDSSGNKAVEAVRTVIVDAPDTIAPVITLNGDLNITVVVDSKFTDPGATATDNVDGTVAVTSDSAITVNMSKAGKYTITYTAKDAAGNVATATRTVTVTATLFDSRTQVSRTANKLVGGATEYTIVSKEKNGFTNTSYFTEVNISGESNLKVMSSYGSYNASKWKMTPLSVQAAAAQAYFNKTEGYENYKVVGILVGDTFNMSTGEPTGALVMNGTKYHNAGGRPYFAILKDGTPVIRSSGASLNDCESAVGGIEIILKDGVISPSVINTNDQYKKIMYSRAAIGIKADGTVVTMSTRGFKIPDSYGLNFYEVAAYLKSMGCVDGLMLDGGGSAQWSSMYEGTEVLKVRNNPSDGYERSVSSAIMVVSTAATDGEFHHAAITPSNEVYTPNSTVGFTATGADNAGGAAELPQGATWVLTDSSFGTVDSNGKFKSTGKMGNVTVQLIYDNTVVGSSTITIAGPDSITFLSPEISIGRGQESDLGMSVRYQNRLVNYKAGDLVWELSNSNMGTVNTDKNTFTASIENTTSGKITVKSAYDNNVAGTIDVIVGQDPTVAMDFEDFIINDGAKIDAFTYWGANSNGKIVGRANFAASGGGINYDIPATGMITTGYYKRGGEESAEIVSRADGYPVHLGSNSLKLNYDMSKTTGTEGANVGLTEDYLIPGKPTAIGLWVYVPENTPNLWLRVRLSIVDDNGNVTSTTQFNFTDECKAAFENRGTYGGLSEVEAGTWKFLSADLSAYSGSRFKMLAGETIRIMWISSNAPISSKYNDRKDVTNSCGIYLTDGTTISKEDCVGSIYVDDLMFIYGSINEDAKAPTVSTFTANDQEMSEDMTFNTNNINFKAMFSDDYDTINNVKPSEIDLDNVYMYVDGQLMKNAIIDNGQMIKLDGVFLANGEHSVKLLVCDKNGNEKVLTYRFTVNNPSSEATMVKLVSRQDKAILGSSLDLDIVSNEVSDIDSVTVTLHIDSKYQDRYDVSASEGYEIAQNSIKYNIVNHTVTFTANRKSDAVSEGNGTIATISFDIPTTLVVGSYFNYSVEAGSIIYADGYSEQNEPSFASMSRKLPVNSAYSITSDLIVAGMTGNYFYVKDANGEGVPGMEVYFSNNNELIGTTDSEGKVSVPSSLTNSVKGFTIYAKDTNGNISFSYTGQSYAAAGAEDSGMPVYVLNNAVSDGFTKRNLSWISNPVYSQAEAKVQISDSEATIESGRVYTGSSELHAFKGSATVSENYAARANGVVLTELVPGGTYYYRVGDGLTWSDIASFTMPKDDGDTNLFILGDIQAEDLTNIQTITQSLQNDDVSYDLGIQTGDAVELASLYSDWKDALELRGQFINNQSMLYAVGNHEQSGESGAEITSSIYNLEDSDYYSVEYGNTYVATISFMSSMNDYKTALEWLVKDAKASDAPHKLLVMHQPAYYTNATEVSNQALHELLPAYVEEAGIDIVFSGHDHSYARTEEINGVTYYICGTSGEKAYPVTINDDFNFIQATIDFTAIYLTVNATDETITVYTYDLIDGVPAVIDTFSKSNIK